MKIYGRIFYLIIFLFLLTQASGVAQNTVENYNLNSKSLITQKDSLCTQDSIVGALSVIQDKRLDSLLKLTLNKDSRKQAFNGFRIQIYAESSIDTSIEQAQEFQNTFLESFPDLRVYLNYYDPDFKIRVGNYRSKIECEGVLRRIKKKYPNCYTVRTLIYFKDLIPLLSEESVMNDSLERSGKVINKDSIELIKH